MARSARITGMNVNALIRRLGPTPATAIIRPATAGPTSRAPLKLVELRPTAFGRSSGGTISEANAWRVGLSTAVTTPWRKAST